MKELSLTTMSFSFQFQFFSSSTDRERELEKCLCGKFIKRERKNERHLWLAKYKNTSIIFSKVADKYKNTLIIFSKVACKYMNTSGQLRSDQYNNQVRFGLENHSTVHVYFILIVIHPKTYSINSYNIFCYIYNLIFMPKVAGKYKKWSVNIIIRSGQFIFLVGLENHSTCMFISSYRLECDGKSM